MSLLRRNRFPPFLNQLFVPNEKPSIDWSHPLSQGLVFYALPGIGALTPTDVATSYFGTNSHPGSSFYGSAAVVNNGDAGTSGAYFVVPTNAPLYSITDATIIVFATVTGLQDYSTFLTIPYRSGPWASPYHALGFNKLSSTSQGFVNWAEAGTSYSNTSAAGFVSTTDGPTCYAVTRSGGTIQFYRNGQAFGSALTGNQTGAIDFVNTQPVVILNHSNSGPGEGIDGSLSIALIYGRALTASEMADICSDPFAVLMQTPVRVFKTPASTVAQTPFPGFQFEPIYRAWLPPDPLPTLKARLTQGAGATSLTYNARPWFENVYRAWIPPDPPPTLATKSVQSVGATAATYNARPWFENVYRAWIPPDPPPTLNVKLVQGAGATSATYNARPWFENVYRAWIPPDPPPTLNQILVQGAGATSATYNARPWINTVVQAWQPPDPPPTLNVKLVQGAGATSATYQNRPWFENVYRAWIPPDPPPTLTAKLIQGAGATSATYQSRPWLDTVLTSWIPPDPPPTLNVKLVQGAGATSATYNARPWFENVYRAWIPPDPLPTLTAKLVQTFVAPAPPAFSYSVQSIPVAVASIPPDPLPTLNVKLIQGAGATSATYNARPWFENVYRAWIPPDPLPTFNVKLIQGAGATAAIYQSRPWLDTVLSAWAPPDPLPTLTAKLVQPSSVAVTPFSNVAQIAAIAATWVTTDPTPQPLQQWLEQGAGPASNTNLSRPWFDVVYGIWALVDPLPTLSAKLPQSAVAVAPPATGYNVQVGPVLAAWAPVAPPPTLTAKLVQGAGATSATYNARPWINTVVQSWQPPDPLPTLNVKLVQGIGATSATYVGRSLASTYIDWLPPDPLPTLTAKLPQGAIPPSPYNPSSNASQFVTTSYGVWLPPDPLPTLPVTGGFNGFRPVSSTMRLNLVDESSIASANLAGLQVLSENQTVDFELYIRYVLPLDGYVFWLGTGRRVPVRGSIHVAADKRQLEDETLAVNRVVLTTGEAVQQFNIIGTNQLWIGSIAGVRFAFSRSGPRYKVAGLYHYNGDAVYPALGNMLVPVGSELSLSTLVVSDSMPIWLNLINYTPIWLNPPNPSITLYPSFLLPDNLAPPYGSVHIMGTRMLQATPLLGPTMPVGDLALGNVTGTNLSTAHWQLVADRVRVTLYGLTNQQAMDWVDLVNRYSFDQDIMGIMSASPMRDDKRTQAELGIIAMKKTIEFEISYYQARANDVAQSLIKTAPLRAVTIDPFVTPL